MAAPATPYPRLLHRKVSEAQREAARRNGARSRGPATAQGKHFSSRNARKHGLFARLHVFSEQEERAFQDCLQDYLGFWQPAGAAELALVYWLAFSDYQQQRAAELEASLLSAAMEQTRETVGQGDTQADHTLRLAVAWESLAENSNILSALSRFEARYFRLYHRTLAELEARADFVERTPELLDSATSALLPHISVVDGRDAGPRSVSLCNTTPAPCPVGVAPDQKTKKRTREMTDSKGRLSNGHSPVLQPGPRQDSLAGSATGQSPGTIG